jgi:pilus assembly protein Flp/PilA
VTCRLDSLDACTPWRPRVSSVLISVSERFYFEEQSMSNLVKNVKNFLVSEDGPTAVEYAVMLALIVVALIAVIKALTGSVSTTFSSVSSAMS